MRLAEFISASILTNQFKDPETSSGGRFYLPFLVFKVGVLLNLFQHLFQQIDLKILKRVQEDDYAESNSIRQRS
ncbi:hypothetical protein ASE74_09440 [Pedobacter sp. Leaf216]|nr:hypothetical protein ASE74_09440 [Pedobacter sp. Leaf216]